MTSSRSRRASMPPAAAATACPTMDELPPGELARVAAYFQVLAEPTRLRLLDLLREGERQVGELARACGCTSANVSRHLALLAQQGLVQRQERGIAAYYRVADATVFALCERVCKCVARRRA